MQAASITPRVWEALRKLRDGAVLEAPPFWTSAERAGWDLYAPLAKRLGTEPWYFAQIGQSLDGRVATQSGDARDISGEDGLAHLHRCRALADAVVIGVRTAIQDDPRLTVRLVPGGNPARVVIDPKGRLPNDARVLANDGTRRIVIQSCDTPRPDGVEVVVLSARDGWIAPALIRGVLAALGLTRVLIEGGGVTIAGFLEAGLLQRLHVAVAPLIIGAGPAGLSTTPIARLADALRPKTHVYGLGTEVLFDCALVTDGSASKSAWPIVQEVEPLAARRA